MALNKSGVCLTCPPAFYQNVTCWPCPVNCQTCQLSGQQVVCTACKSQLPLKFTLTNNSCQLTQYALTSLTGNQSNFDYTNWTSS
jgi:hypothetical protein